MKIVIINSRYFVSAGPESYMFKIKEILEKKGHTVVPFSNKSNKNEKTKYEKYFVRPIGDENQTYFSEYRLSPKTIVQIIGRQFYSYEVKRKLVHLITQEKPDIAYLLHHQNKLSPSVIDACREKNVPVVMRLSDFTLVCPESHLYRDKKPCEDCIKKNLLQSIIHRCVKKSFFASLIKTCATKYQRLTKVYQRVDHIISPTEFTINKVKWLLKGKKFSHLPTLIISPGKPKFYKGKYLLFVGRTEENKGVLQAIKAVEGTNFKLKIAGKSSTGYDKIITNYIANNKISDVEFLGEVPHNSLGKLYEESCAVIIPALWYENLPNVALEAMAYGKPILGSNRGSMKEIVSHKGNGLLFDPTNILSMRECITQVFEDKKLWKQMSKASYMNSVTKYNPKTHYEKLIKIFEDTLEETL